MTKPDDRRPFDQARFYDALSRLPAGSPLIRSIRISYTARNEAETIILEVDGGEFGPMRAALCLPECLGPEMQFMGVPVVLIRANASQVSFARGQAFSLIYRGESNTRRYRLGGGYRNDDDDRETVTSIVRTDSGYMVNSSTGRGMSLPADRIVKDSVEPIPVAAPASS